jgi:hypothetical protein
MTAGRPLVNAWAQGPAAKVSWLSSRVWASGSEALAQRSFPSPFGEHDPGGVDHEQLFGRHYGLLQGGGQILLGVQVGQGGDALGQQGRIDGHGVAFASGRRTGEPGQQARQHTLGCRSGPTAPRCRRVGFSRSRRRHQRESAM